jgi:hypothetical protein
MLSVGVGKACLQCAVPVQLSWTTPPLVTYLLTLTVATGAEEAASVPCLLNSLGLHRH